MNASRADLGSSTSSSSRAPPSGFPVEGSEPIQRLTRPVPIRPPELGASSAAGELGARASPSSSSLAAYPDNYAVAVGSTAYHVTTLLPLRATILSPAGPPAASPVSASDSPGTAAERAPSQGAEVREASAESESAAAAAGTGKRRRRTRADKDKDKESASSESSEQAQAPKSKKTLIACHFCRGERPTCLPGAGTAAAGRARTGPGCAGWGGDLGSSAAVRASRFVLTSSVGTVARKLRCDGQKPSCANCRKRSHPCTYEQEPKRRGPGKTPRGSSRRRGRQGAAPPAGGSGGGGSGAETSTGRGEGASMADVAGLAGAAPVPGLSASFPYTRSAFEPQLTGEEPRFPGFSYRPPSPSSSSNPASRPFVFLSMSGSGPTRGAASEGVHSTATSSAASGSAASVPHTPTAQDSEEERAGSHDLE